MFNIFDSDIVTANAPTVTAASTAPSDAYTRDVLAMIEEGAVSVFGSLVFSRENQNGDSIISVAYCDLTKEEKEDIDRRFSTFSRSLLQETFRLDGLSGVETFAGADGVTYTVYNFSSASGAKSFHELHKEGAFLNASVEGLVKQLITFIYHYFQVFGHPGQDVDCFGGLHRHTVYVLPGGEMRVLPLFVFRDAFESTTPPEVIGGHADHLKSDVFSALVLASEMTSQNQNGDEFSDVLIAASSVLVAVRPTFSELVMALESRTEPPVVTADAPSKTYTAHTEDCDDPTVIRIPPLSEIAGRMKGWAASLFKPLDIASGYNANECGGTVKKDAYRVIPSQKNSPNGGGNSGLF